MTMTHMKWILLVGSILSLALTVPNQNPFVGTWVMHDLQGFSKKDVIPDSVKLNFQASITFHADGTYTKTVNGNTTTSTYKTESNKLFFLRTDASNREVTDFMLRWPVGTADPYPFTAIIDIAYPELIPLKNKKGITRDREVYVLYKKR